MSSLKVLITISFSKLSNPSDTSMPPDGLDLNVIVKEKEKLEFRYTKFIVLNNSQVSNSFHIPELYN